MEVLISSSLPSWSWIEVMLNTILLWFWPSEDVPNRVHLCFPALLRSQSTSSPLRRDRDTTSELHHLHISFIHPPQWDACTWNSWTPTESVVPSASGHEARVSLWSWGHSRSLVSSDAAALASSNLQKDGKKKDFSSSCPEREIYPFQKESRWSSQTFSSCCAPDPHCLVFASRCQIAALPISYRWSQGHFKMMVALVSIVNTKSINTKTCYLHCPLVCCRGHLHRQPVTRLKSGSHRHAHANGASPRLSYSHQSKRSSRLCTWVREALLRSQIAGIYSHQKTSPCDSGLLRWADMDLTLYEQKSFVVESKMHPHALSYPTATVLQVWGEQDRQKMDRGSGKQLAVSPVWYQWHTTTPFSSPDTTRLQSTGDQWTAVMAVCTQGKRASETSCQSQVGYLYIQTAAYGKVMVECYRDVMESGVTLTWWAAYSLIRDLTAASQKRRLPSLEELTQMWLWPAWWLNEKPDTRSRWPTSSPEVDINRHNKMLSRVIF